MNVSQIHTCSQIQPLFSQKSLSKKRLKIGALLRNLPRTVLHIDMNTRLSKELEINLVARLSHYKHALFSLEFSSYCTKLVSNIVFSVLRILETMQQSY